MAHSHKPSESILQWALGFGNVAAAFADRALKFGDHDFLQVLPETARIYELPPQTYSFAQMQIWVARLQAMYAEAGYGEVSANKNTEAEQSQEKRTSDEKQASEKHTLRVGLLLENRPAFLAHWLALNALGVSVVPISAEMRIAELSYLIAHSEIALVVALTSHHSLLRQAAAREGRTLAVIADGDAVPARTGGRDSARLSATLIRPSLMNDLNT